MLDAKEIDIEIAKWEYLDSSYDNYAKLANLYTIRDHMTKSRALPEYEIDYSAAAAPMQNEGTIAMYGDSEFLQSISGKDPAVIWGIIDELMDTLHIANPRVYNNVMRKINKM